MITLAVFAFAFGTTPRSNAGTDMIEPNRAPAPRYNYAPPPRPILYAPPPVVGVGIGPRFWGPRFGFFRGHRFFGRHAFRRGHHHHWR